MVQLVITTRILSAIEAIPESRREDLDLPEPLSLNSPISHDQVIGLSRYLKSNPDDHDGDSNTPTSLNSLLHGTKVYVPPPPKKPEPVRSCFIKAIKNFWQCANEYRPPNTSPKKPASSPPSKQTPTTA